MVRPERALMNRRRSETRWCPRHDNEIKRGTLRCRRCTVDLPIAPRRRLIVDPSKLKPMRARGQPTKRANERRTKGYR